MRVGTEWAGVLNVLWSIKYNRKKVKQAELVCKLLVSEELDCGRLLLRLKRAVVRPTWTKDAVGISINVSIIYGRVEPRTSSLSL